DQQPGDEVALDEALLHCLRPLRNQLPAAVEVVAVVPDSDLDGSLGVGSLDADSFDVESLGVAFLPELSPHLSLDFALLPLFLKSVAYQPVPFNWNPAAVTIFLKLFLPHSGHLVSGASFRRCRYSFWKPHLAQRYS